VGHESSTLPTRPYSGVVAYALLDATKTSIRLRILSSPTLRMCFPWGDMCHDARVLYIYTTGPLNGFSFSHYHDRRSVADS
jgi:hypothetical protein